MVDECIACAERGEAVLFHCQKGKDRTGLVAVLLEEVIGVPRADVVVQHASASPITLCAILATRSPSPARGEERERVRRERERRAFARVGKRPFSSFP